MIAPSNDHALADGHVVPWNVAFLDLAFYELRSSSRFFN
jgi:hypothetical protein